VLVDIEALMEIAYGKANIYKLVKSFKSHDRAIKYHEFSND
jgi:hypothetical protein